MRNWSEFWTVNIQTGNMILQEQSPLSSAFYSVRQIMCLSEGLFAKTNYSLKELHSVFQGFGLRMNLVPIDISESELCALSVALGGEGGQWTYFIYF